MKTARLNLISDTRGYHNRQMALLNGIILPHAFYINLHSNHLQKACRDQARSSLHSCQQLGASPLQLDPSCSTLVDAIFTVKY
jgi:hypothetical protein